MKDTKRLRGLRALGLTCVLAVGLAPATAQAEAMQNEAGIGAASALCSLIYGPVKIVYATAGLVFGGIAWGLSGGDSQVMQAVLTTAVRGDYVVTPSHLRMERPLEFLGREPGYREIQHASVVSDDLEPVSAPPSGDYTIKSEDY